MTGREGLLGKGHISEPHNPFSTAREWVGETGLYYYRARYYDSAAGRFMQVDPIGCVNGMSLYEYVSSNPNNWIDPLGLLRYWGQWGGPNWTGGQCELYENLSEEEQGGLKEPEDSMDECFKQHDLDFSKCRVKREKNKCKYGEEKATENYNKCIERTNKKLDKCLKRLPKDPRKWPKPPQKGKERTARIKRWCSIMIF